MHISIHRGVPAGKTAAADDRCLRLAKAMLRLFAGREEYVAVADGGTFAPEALFAPLDPQRLARSHLAGRRALGLYFLTPQNQVRCACVDLDNKPRRPDPSWREKAEKVAAALAEAGLSPLVEVSQSGAAAHIWLFFSKPIAARLPRQFLHQLVLSLGIPVPEIYPRQDVLAEGGLGNLMRYPLWGESYFPDLADRWSPRPPLQALRQIQPVSRAQMAEAAERLGISLGAPPPATPQATPVAAASDAGIDRLPPRVQRLIARDQRFAARWRGDMSGLKDPSRSAVAFSLAAMMVARCCIPTSDIKAAIRGWCVQNNYDKGQRPEWIAQIVDKVYDSAELRLTNGSIPRPAITSVPRRIAAARRTAVRSRANRKRNHS